MESPEQLSVAEAATRVGLTAHTLRWYEQVGLLDPISRDGAGRRRYRDSDVARLVFLNRLRSTGMPVKDMLRYVQLVREGPATADARRDLLHAHRERVLNRMADLRRDLDAIDFKIKLDETRELI